MSHINLYHRSTYFQINSANKQNIPFAPSTSSEDINDSPSTVSPTNNPVESSNRPLPKKQKTLHDIQPLDSNSSKKCTDAITIFVVGTMQPFNVVASQTFINMIKTFNPRYMVPSRKHFSKTVIPKLYNDVVENIKKELLSADGNDVCITTDCWTSLAKMPYIAVTAHFIGDEWNFKSVCLSCTGFEDNHTSENITRILKDILSDWNLDAEKVTCYTTDNASNIIKAISMLDIPHMPCFGHTINIGINKAFQIPVVERALSRLKKLQSTVAHS